MSTFSMAANRFLTPSALMLAMTVACGVAVAQTAAPAAVPKVAAKKPVGKAAAKAPAKVIYVPPEASAEQVEAADRVYYGVYDCEFSQTIHIVADTKYPAYVNVKHLKTDYLMKPVVSSTGAIRLEDTGGETLMVQIANKSMLLNVKTGQRVVDDCVSPKQRELMAAMAAAKAAQGADATPTTSMLSGATSK